MAVPGRAALVPKHLGLSLFTVRGPMASNPAETYRALGKMGITELEVRPENLRDHGAMMKAAGVKPVHLFIEPAVITGAWDEWRELMARMAAHLKVAPPRSDAPKPTLSEMIALCKAHGLRRLGVSFLLPGERDGAIGKLNPAAVACAEAGLEFYYHNHAF